MLSVKQLRDIKNCGEIECGTCSAIGYCADEIDLSKELAETALEYRKMLERLEWAQDIQGIGEYCPACGEYKGYGHTPDCELAALLKESEVE